MPLFRQERFVADAVVSVLAQDDVVCEVIISDDASGDETLQLALDAIHRASGSHPHRVRVRRGTRRLRRGHVIDLLDHAACDVVVQAHGDDIALPGRMRELHAAMVAHEADFAASLHRSIDEHGEVIVEEAEPVPSSSGTVRAVGFGEAVERPPWAIGAVEAWRVSSLRRWRPLSAHHAPLAHDRIVLMRAALRGRAVLLEKELVERRLHGGNWRDRLVDDSSELRRKHGWALSRTIIYDTVLRDIDDAEQQGLCPADDARAARALARAQRDRAIGVLRTSHGELLALGEQLAWEPDDTAG